MELSLTKEVIGKIALDEMKRMNLPGTDWWAVMLGNEKGSTS